MVFSIPPERQTPFVHDSEPNVCPCGHPNVPNEPESRAVELLRELVDEADEQNIGTNVYNVTPPLWKGTLGGPTLEAARAFLADSAAPSEKPDDT